MTLRRLTPWIALALGLLTTVDATAQRLPRACRKAERGVERGGCRKSFEAFGPCLQSDALTESQRPAIRDALRILTRRCERQAVRIDPTEVRRVAAQDALAPSWSHNGKKLAVEVQPAGERVPHTLVFDAAGGRGQRVIPDTGPEGDSFDEERFPTPVRGLRWHPQGRAFMYLTFPRARTGHWQVFFDWEGCLTCHRAFERGTRVGARWSRPGKHFAVVRSNGDPDTVALELVDIMNLERGPRVLYRSDQGVIPMQPRFGASERVLLFAGYAPDAAESDLLMTEDTREAPAKFGTLVGLPGSEQDAVFSPDGEWIAFLHEPRGAAGVFDLYTADLAGQSAPRLVATGVVRGSGEGPVWTADGRRILTVRADPDARDPIVWIDVGTGEQGLVQSGTEHNRDLALYDDGDGAARLAWTAQGRVGDEEKRWRGAYVTELVLP